MAEPMIQERLLRTETLSSQRAIYEKFRQDLQATSVHPGAPTEAAPRGRDGGLEDKYTQGSTRVCFKSSKQDKYTQGATRVKNKSIKRDKGITAQADTAYSERHDQLENYETSDTNYTRLLERLEAQQFVRALERARQLKPRIRVTTLVDLNAGAATATELSPQTTILQRLTETMAELAKGVQANSAALAKMASGKGRGAQKKSHEERIKSITCYGCGQKGHYKHTCENECTTCKDKLGAFYKDHIGKDCEFNRKNGFKSVKRVHVATPADTMMASAQDYFKSLMGEDDHEWCFGGQNSDDVEEKSRNIE
jgi:hypothetical protein